SLRWAQDGENVEYQDVDGKWRRLTGEEGEFTVWGTPEKPFEEKTKSRIYQWSSEKLEDGSWRRPNPFTVNEALGPDGKLREIWDRNDFGPKSIEMKDDKGMRMTIFFHSSPADEATNVFLDYSHGCIHMKPQDLQAMAGYLERGSGIRISSFEEILSRAQFEKPEGGDEPTG
ncbi:MAG: L,D-transpeptidase, partial [Candidatus Uhrbacteria bacterium]|nr:L,D-transpeptidase [Candidatus Uhrbacteria bacterium]